MTHYDSLIFSAAGAFVSLPRPGRNDADRLDALAIPLFESLSIEGKRRIAAVLSECRSVMPEKLVEALLIQPLDISASLLISRAEIPDAILEKAIGIGGESHARVIALKYNISASIKRRIDTLVEGIVPLTEVAIEPLYSKPASLFGTGDRTRAQTELELAQDRLRDMMMRKTLPDRVSQRSVAPFPVDADINIVARLINLALEGDPDFLSTALADEWSAPFAVLRPLVKRNGIHSLTILLKGLEFGATDTFAIVSAFNPLAFASREAIASFYLKFQSITETDVKLLTAAFHVEATDQSSIQSIVA